MKCPHCGSVLEDDRDTVIDDRGSLPRLSDIDRRWEMTVHDDPTKIQVVPSFRMPESFLRRKVVSDSQRPTPIKTMRPRLPPRRWLITLLVLVLGVGLGVLFSEGDVRIFRTLDQVRSTIARRCSPIPR